MGEQAARRRRTSWRHEVGTCRYFGVSRKSSSRAWGRNAHLRKKWNRSVTSKNFFLPWKNAPRAREMSGVSEYSEIAAKEKSDPSDEMFFWRWRFIRTKSK